MLNSKIDTAWVPQARVWYRTKHRRTDETTIQTQWDPARQVVHINNSPPGIRRRWKNAVRSKKEQWMNTMVEETQRMSQNSNQDEASVNDTCIVNWTRLIDDITNSLPLFHNNNENNDNNAPTVHTDIRNDAFRFVPGDGGGDNVVSILDMALTDLDGGNNPTPSPTNKRTPSATIILFWAYFQRGLCYMRKKSSDVYANAREDLTLALQIMPTVTYLPSAEELVVRYKLAQILFLQAEWEQALREFKLCMAVLQLLMYRRVIDLNLENPLDTFARTHCHDLIIQTLQAAVHLKVAQGAVRPYFTRKETFELYRHLGIGLFTRTNYRCVNCRASVRRRRADLFMCPSCTSVWVCNQACLNAAWREHKKQHGFTKDKMTAIDCRTTKQMLERTTTICSVGSGRDNPILLCYDCENEELFDPFTNDVMQMQSYDFKSMVSRCSQTELVMLSLLVLFLVFSFGRTYERKFGQLDDVDSVVDRIFEVVKQIFENDETDIQAHWPLRVGVTIVWFLVPWRVGVTIVLLLVAANLI